MWSSTVSPEEWLIFTEASKNTDFYQSHLNRVSRSFAFCIEELQQPFRDDVALAYILCRLVDTVEDSLWQNKKDQLQSFDEFIQFVELYASHRDVKDWTQSFPDSIPESEKLLLKDSFSFFNALHDLGDDKKDIFQRSILNMTRGMRYFCERQKKLSLDSHQETNQYCFFVAGVVGELLSELFHLEESNFSLSQETYRNSIHFGLFLQKINLLKDQMQDLKEGRQLISNRKEIRNSLGLHAQSSLEYILTIPSERKDYRIFCAWSFFLGLISLSYIDKAWEKQKEVKISRTEAFFFLKKIKRGISDNSYLQDQFDQLSDTLNGSADTDITSSGGDTSWLIEVYQGPLTPEDFHALGMG